MAAPLFHRFKYFRLGVAASMVVSAALTSGCATTNYGDEQFRLGMATHGKDVMWVPSKANLVQEMLLAAKVTPKDIVYDLGSGDGIIPIEAAKNFGVRAVGIEYNQDLVELSVRNAKRAGVDHLVSLKRGDIFVEDFSQATVLTLYLGDNLNMKLKPKILQMKPGTRVVSNTFRMGSWIPDQEIRGSSGDLAFLWIVPAQVDGEWDVKGLPMADSVQLKIVQKKQFFDGSLTVSGKRSILFENGRITGREIQFKFTDETGKPQFFSASIDAGQMVGGLVSSPSVSPSAEPSIKISARRVER